MQVQRTHFRVCRERLNSVSLTYPVEAENAGKLALIRYRGDVLEMISPLNGCFGMWSIPPQDGAALDHTCKWGNCPLRL